MTDLGLSDGGIYTIDITEFVPGEYMLVFQNESLKVGGTFEKE